MMRFNVSFEERENTLKTSFGENTQKLKALFGENTQKIKAYFGEVLKEDIELPDVIFATDEEVKNMIDKIFET